jgi:hypothetical protein
MSDPSINDRLSSLLGLQRPALEAIWGQLFEGDPSLGIRKELLLKFLAYRMQERQFGALSSSSHRRLRELAGTLVTNSAPSAQGRRSSPELDSYGRGTEKCIM